MKVFKTKIKNVTIFEPNLFRDDRGFFQKLGTKKNLKNFSMKKLILYKTTCHFQKKM